MFIRGVLTIPIVLLIALVVGSFFVVRDLNVAHRKTQLTFGTIAEPDTLNPILSTTTAASAVENFVFNGLVKRDENLRIVGDLAADFRITQTSTAFFESETEARAAVDKLLAAADRWEDMNLSSCRKAGSQVILEFADPHEQVVAGTSYEKTLLDILDGNLPRPVSVMTITFIPNAEFADGTKANVAAMRERLRALAESTEGAEIHEVLPISTSILSVSIIGDAQAFRDGLLEALAGRPKEDEEEAQQVGELFDQLDQALLNEPKITFTLRKGVRWHDGEAVTSADAAFTYRSILDPKYRSPRASSYWPVKFVRTPDPHTFEVVYRIPYGECLESWGMSLIPKHILEGKDPQWWADEYNIAPVGTGPFRFEEWKRNEYVRLKANPDYFRGSPNLPAVVFRVLPDPFVNQAAFEARGFDTYTLATYQVERYKSQPQRFHVFQRWGLGYVHIGWNLRKPMFADRRVRIALAHAIDVDRIVNSVYLGNARPSNGTFPQQMWYANKNLQPYAYDPDRARAMLAEAGWSDSDGDGWLDKDGKPFEFNLITNNGNTNRQLIQQLVQDDLKKVGIKVDTDLYEWAVFIGNYINTRQFDACILGWYLGYSHDLFQLWHSSQAEPPGLNQCGYVNPEVDRLLIEIRTTFNRDRIAKLCARLQKIIYRDQPYMFLVNAYASSALYRDLYVVRRPDQSGSWIVEPIRDTEAGYTIYAEWWAPQAAAPQIAP